MNRLAICPEAPGLSGPCRLAVVADAAAIAAAFAGMMVDEDRTAEMTGRKRVVFIVPASRVTAPRLRARLCRTTIPS